MTYKPHGDLITKDGRTSQYVASGFTETETVHLDIDTSNTLIAYLLIDISNTETVSDIDFQLEEGGTISGYVYEKDGVTPVVDACLDISSEAPQWNEITTWLQRHSTVGFYNPLIS